jgi:hypothetical protein
MYIDDGVVAQIIQYAQDDKFFNWYLIDFVWRVKRQFILAMTIIFNIFYIIMSCPKTKAWVVFVVTFPKLLHYHCIWIISTVILAKVGSYQCRRISRKTSAWSLTGSSSRWYTLHNFSLYKHD